MAVKSAKKAIEAAGLSQDVIRRIIWRRFHHFI